MYNIGVTDNLIFVSYFPAGSMRISVVTVLMTGGELWVHVTFVTFWLIWVICLLCIFLVINFTPGVENYSFLINQGKTFPGCVSM